MLGILAASFYFTENVTVIKILPSKMKSLVLTISIVAFWAAAAYAQCPWSRDPQLVELQSSCVCNTSGKEGFNAISVQCQAVNFPMLMSALRSYTSDIILENLYISNTTIGNTNYSEVSN